MMERKIQRALWRSAMAGALLMGGHAALASEFTYTGNVANGVWSGSSWAWVSGTGSYPNGVGAIANVTNDFTLNNGLSILAPVTLGTLNVGDTTAPTRLIVIANGNVPANTLTFDNGSSPAYLSQTVNSGLNSIAVPIKIMSSLVVSNASTTNKLSLEAFFPANPVSGTGSIESGASSGTQTLEFSGVSAAGGSVASPISNGTAGGMLGVTVSGGGTWSLAATNSTYTGATTVTGGTLSLTGSLSTSSVTVNGGTYSQSGNLLSNVGLTVNTGGTATISAGSGNTYSGTTTVGGGTLNLTGTINGSPLLVNSGTFNQTSAGVLSGATSLTVNNGGLASLSGTGTNTYAGLTKVNDGGVVQILNLGRLSTNSNLTLNGGVLESLTSTITFNWQLGTGAGQVQWTGSGGFSTKNTSSSNNIKISLMNSSGVAGGTLTWGQGYFVPNGSALIFGSASAAGSAMPDFQNPLDLNGAARTITVNGTATTTAQISGSISSSTGTLVKNGPGVLALVNSNNNYGGGTSVQAGTLFVGSSATNSKDTDLGVAPGVAGDSAHPNVTLSNGAALMFNAPGSGFTLGATRTIYLDGGGALKNYYATPTTINGAIYGTGGLTIGGLAGSSVTLNNSNNSYTGGTTVIAGTMLCQSVAGALKGDLTLNDGAVQLISNTTFTSLVGTTAASVSGYQNWISGTPNVNLNVASGSYSYAGSILDNGSKKLSLTKSGSGTQILTGATSNYTGGTIINGGTLGVNAENNLGAVSGGLTINTGGTLEAIAGFTTNRNITINGNTTIQVDSDTLTLSNSLLGSGSLTKTGSGSLALPTLPTHGLTLSSGTLILKAGTTHALTVLANSQITMNGGTLDLATNDMLVTGGKAQLTQMSTHLRAPVDGTLYGAAVNTTVTTGILTGDQWRDMHGGQLGTQTPQPDDLVLRYTYAGDANLDGVITMDDYLQIDTGYLFDQTGWAYGDFNHDGKIDVNDYAAIDTNYAAQRGALADEMISLHASWFGDVYTDAMANLQNVPEPGSLLLLGLGVSGLLLRRRR